ncbi:hypothetical protein [Mucilaginibacter flavus]|uniref:hypothetical protein n=1 Tax=Mucilaginibacter flavus TaxID=931504 RepID=UPI0025B35EDE|nr:hypothetical protein [Mucilaginibacter flavus]MDN3581239.1 hypothetical protein [Mucilaginibacter flavus]
MIKLFWIILIIISFICSVQAQVLIKPFPKNARMTTRFLEAIAERAKDYDNYCYKDSAITKHYSASFMLDKIDRDSDYRFLFLAESWIAFHYKEMIPDLIKRVTDKKEVGLTNSADLIILERIKSKQLQFYGHGGYSADDLFTIGGRANRLLKKITGENFGRVSMYSTHGELVALQKKWIEWFDKL